MGLPTSREGPIGPHAPITSTRIAAIEDCIVGYKRAPTTNMYGGNAFKLISGAGTLADAQWTFSVSSRLTAEIMLERNTTIQLVQWYHARNGVGTITLKIRGRDALTLSAPFDIVSTVVNTGTGYTSTLVASGGLLPYQIPDTASQTVSVWLEAQCDNAAHVFAGAVIAWSRL